MATTPMEHRFNAAVNVIRGLPKNGSYQPSNDMLLRFYSFYKQAVQGPCTQRKPGFWDVINRAKWEAYRALGDMSKERAMELYVEELKKIIETMSYTDNVAEFMGSINELNGVDVDDLEVVAPEAIKKAKSHPNSPFASRESSPIRKPQNGHHHITNGNHNFQENVHTNGQTSEYSDDEYIDTVEDDSTLTPEQMQHHFSRSSTRKTTWPTVQQQSRVFDDDQTTSSSNHTNISPAINQMLRTIESMKVDLEQINNRISIVERSLTEVKNHQLRKKIMELKNPQWWPFIQISPNWFIFMIVWPFLAQRLVHIIQRKRK